MLAAAMAHAAPPTSPTAEIGTFFKRNCYDCHRGSKSEAGLDLSKLPRNLASDDTKKHWVRVFDRVAAGEMPPPKDADLDKDEKVAFIKSAGDWIRGVELDRYNKTGRVEARRLTNLQLERSLHDLLGIDIPLAKEFPDEQPAERFSTVADGQPMSRYQLERHMDVVDLALDEAIRRAVSEPDEFTKEFDAAGLSRSNPNRRCREPEVIDGFGVIWSSGLIFYGRVPATTARERGWYQITVRAKALKSPKNGGVWCTVQTGPAVSSAPLMNWAGSFEATDDVRAFTFEAWLERGDMFEVRPGDTTLRKARFDGGQVGVGEGGPQNVPGVAMQSIKLQRIHHGPTNEQIRAMLFDDLQVKTQKNWRRAELASSAPKKDLRRLIERFAERAFRRPVDKAAVDPYVAIAEEALSAGEPLIEALRVGYRAVLCSPRFLYFYETPGKLDAYAVATRLSYFLWNAPPDKKLTDLAASGKLTNPDTLLAETRRMLRDPRGKAFLEDFAAEWLDLNQIDFTTPDRRLYPTFDDVVKHGMLDETHAYLQAMLDQNLGVTNLVDSDFTFLNSRLARYYHIDGVDGDELRRVKLPASSHRGGLLGQGAVLKVTANGTTTSPVLRGKWINERLLGNEVPPPPPNVPAIEPDIRGAKSIRDQLAKHRSIETCAACHKNIDPPGFALENFDPAGLWRDRYGKKGAKVDPSYTLADGRKFKDLEAYRALVVAEPQTLARNVAEQLMTYGTGAPIGFADRPVIHQIVQATRGGNFGLASIVEQVVTSRTFLQK
ncbi:MAG: DUF1592 domain-containing protein [Phycisphaera sp.]|nr:DUF1592 domain-containing protein [Phycisphaera sp.]